MVACFLIDADGSYLVSNWEFLHQIHSLNRVIFFRSLHVLRKNKKRNNLYSIAQEMGRVMAVLSLNYTLHIARALAQSIAYH